MRKYIFIVFSFCILFLFTSVCKFPVWAEKDFHLNFKETSFEMIKALQEWQFGEPGILLAIEFSHKSFEIEKSSLKLLKELGKALSHPSLRNKRFIIKGHTDNDGSDKSNMSLSLKRAFSIKIYLGQYYSISGSNLSVTGLGERKPLVPNTSSFNKRLNRRIEIMPDISNPPLPKKKIIEKKLPKAFKSKSKPNIPFTPKSNFTENQLRKCLVKNNYYAKKWPWNSKISNEKGRFKNFFKQDPKTNNKTIFDFKTRLMWQTKGSNLVNWKEAKEYISQLNRQRYADYNNWRLPTVKELASLIEERINKKKLYINPLFSSIQKSCWTINTYNDFVWVAFFNYGNIYYSLEENENYVRAVRSIKK